MLKKQKEKKNKKKEEKKCKELRISTVPSEITAITQKAGPRIFHPACDPQNEHVMREYRNRFIFDERLIY